MTQNQIDTFFAMDIDIAPETLIAFAHDSLLQMARSDDPAKKSWLRNYLAAAPDSAAKAELMKALVPPTGR